MSSLGEPRDDITFLGESRDVMSSKFSQSITNHDPRSICKLLDFTVLAENSK